MYTGKAGWELGLREADKRNEMNDHLGMQINALCLLEGLLEGSRVVEKEALLENEESERQEVYNNRDILNETRKHDLNILFIFNVTVCGIWEILD